MAEELFEEESAFAEAPEFEIDENGTLVKYNGPGGDVTIPSEVKKIGEEAFFNYDISDSAAPVTSLTVLGDLTEIGYGALFKCKALRSVTFKGSVGDIYSEAFSGCSNLTSVEFGSSVSRIGPGAFSGCTSLSSVKFGGDVLSIGYEAFLNCFALPSLTVPGTDVRVSSWAFMNCASLKSASFPDGMNPYDEEGSYDEASCWIFKGCASLESFQWPEGLAIIPDEMFENCTSLTEFKIPACVSIIGSGAFEGSGLKTIHIPSTVTEIRDYAFAGCKSLKKIEIEEGVKNLGECVFDYVPATTIALPESLKNIALEYDEYPSSETVFSNCGATMVVVKGSYAEEFCKEYRVPFKYSDGTASGQPIYSGSLIMYVGQKIKKPAKSKVKGEKFTYESSDPEAVTVDQSGKITALEYGWTTITVTGSKSGMTAKCEVTVYDGKERLELQYKKYDELNVGDVIEMRVDDSWYSSDTWVASLSKKGIVTAVREYFVDEDTEDEYEGYVIRAAKVGTTTLTVKTPSGKKASCKITVKKEPAKSAKLKMSKKSITAFEGQNVKPAIKFPKGSYSPVVSWSSTNQDVVVTEPDPDEYYGYYDFPFAYAIGPGTTELTATTRSGQSASCNVTVLPGPKDMYVPETLVMAVGEKYTIEPEITEGTKTAFTYETYDYDYEEPAVTVDQKGKITAKRIGYAEVYVYTCNDLEGYIEVSVLAAPSSVTVNGLKSQTQTLSVGDTYRFTPEFPEGTGSLLKVKSSKSKVASVAPVRDEPGTYEIKALKSGSATITIQAGNKKKATITVKVSK